MLHLERQNMNTGWVANEEGWAVYGINYQSSLHVSLLLRSDKIDTSAS
jgi:hypothetical protein